MATQAPSKEQIAEMVPVCGSPEIKILRAIWDEAWIAYKKEYGGDQRQHDRLLAQGFYAAELDQFYPKWRPVMQQFTKLAAELDQAREREKVLIDLVREGLCTHGDSCTQPETCGFVIEAKKALGL